MNDDDINVCRLCLANSGSVRMLNGDNCIENTLKKHNIDFEKNVTKNDGLCDSVLRHICEVCWTKVTDFDEFYVQCERLHAMYVANEVIALDDGVEVKPVMVFSPLCVLSVEPNVEEIHDNLIVLGVPDVMGDQAVDSTENPIKTEPKTDERKAKINRHASRKYCDESEESSGRCMSDIALHCSCC